MFLYNSIIVYTYTVLLYWNSDIHDDNTRPYIYNSITFQVNLVYPNSNHILYSEKSPNAI